MKSFSFPKLLSLFSEEQPPDFIAWRIRRTKLCSLLGPTLLGLTESEINTLFNQWENDIANKLHSEKETTQLTTLMAISILNYFRRNFELFNKTFSVIQQYAASQYRSICEASVNVVCWAAEELSDNRIFLRQLVESALNWLQSTSREQLIFNALIVLKEVGKTLPTDVFNVSAKFFFPEIWSAVCSEDKELRDAAIKVTEIHLQQMPHHSSDPFSVFLFKHCVQCIQTKSVPIMGPILSCRTLFHVSQTIINVPQMIDLLQKSLSGADSDLAKPIFDFLVELAEESPKSNTINSSKKTIVLLRMSINKYPNDAAFIAFLPRFIKAMEMDSSIISSIISAILLIVSDSALESMYDSAYNVLICLLRKYPDVQLPTDVFKSSAMCAGMIELLSIQRQHLQALKPQLADTFAVCLQRRNSTKDALLCLELVKAFGEDIFEGLDVVYEMTRHFSFSDDSKVRAAFAETLPIFKLREANNDLLRLALYDQSKDVRVAALAQLSPEDCSDYLVQLLSDSSSTVRKAAVPIVASLAKSNPFMVVPIITTFVSDFIIKNVCSGDSKRSAKASSLLPAIAEHFAPIAPHAIPLIGYVCVHYLMHGEPFPDVEPSGERARKISNAYSQVRASNFQFLDLRSAIHADFVNGPLDVKSDHQTRLYQIENERWLEERDMHLFDTIRVLARELIPYVFQIAPAFVRAFRHRHRDSVLLSALRALRELVVNFKSKVKFSALFPDLVPSLLQLLSDDCSRQVAVMTIKVAATMGATSAPKNHSSHELAVDHLLLFKQPSFFTDFVMDELINLLRQPTPAVFEAITIIMNKETQYSLKYLGQIVPAFVDAIKATADPAKLFAQLEVIVMSCGIHISPYIRKLAPVLCDHLGELSCLRACVTFSYELKSEFQPATAMLYPLALNLLSTGDHKFLKILLRFITYSVLFQHPCVDMFLEGAQIILQSGERKRINSLLSHITMLVQQCDIQLYTSRLAQMCFGLLRTNFSDQLQQLLYSLMLYSELPTEIVEQVTNSAGVTLQHLPDVVEIKKRRRPFEAEFLQQTKPLLNIEHLNYIMYGSKPATVAIFKSLPEPSFNNTKKWIEDLCTHLVTHSPSVAIQCCGPIISQNATFRQDLFPIAFLSCWKTAKALERQQFANIVKSILQSYDTVDPMIFFLAEVLDKCGMPLEIDDAVLAASCRSSALSLFFLQRYVKEHPNDRSAVEDLLRLNNRMGRIDSARGLLAGAGKVIGSEAGRWNEELGEWDKALDIYVEQGNASGIIRSHAHLEQWDEIRKMEPQFSALPPDEQDKSALWLGWAFYHSHDLAKASQYVEMCTNISDPNVSLFRAILLVASEQYQQALDHIERCFQALTESRQVYSGADSAQASKNLVLAQHLIELQEVIEVKRKGIKSVPEIWQQRLHSFATESDAWTKLIEIRSLLLSPDEHIDACLKLLSVLRKERRWRLLDAYFGRLFSAEGQPQVAISLLKVMWARGDKAAAVAGIKYLNGSAEETPTGPYAEYLVNATRLLKEKRASSEFLAKALRIQATWEYGLYKAKTASSEVLTDIIDVFRKSMALKEDYRAWSGLAYASSRALSHKPDERGVYAAEAIKAFLKATQLRPSDSMEYLCQMFSIFVRYGEDIELPDDVRKEMIGLPAAIVHQIIPQIIVHIAHHDEKVSSIINAIICAFADNHFEAVVYSLVTLSLIDDKSKADVAKDLLNSLGRKHPQQHSDAMALITGMHRCAISATERWLTALDTAIRLHHQGDIPTVCRIIQDQYDNLANPVCEQDRQFARMYGTALNRVKGAFVKYRDGDASVTRAMWEGFKAIFAELDDRMKKTDSMQLSKIAQELADKDGYSISVPGTYNVDGGYPLLGHIGETLNVFATQQHPRTVEMFDTSGAAWKFLLKGNEDLRLDQRIMQFFTLINALLKTNRVTSKLAVSIVMYAVIPIAPDAGLISWVTGADTMQQLVIEYRQQRDIHPSVESEVIGHFAIPQFNSLNAAQRLEVYGVVCEKTSGDELKEMLWLRSPTPSAWVDHSYCFTVSTALMSMAGYVIGLGDRHPSNIMVQRHTGRVIHIDFGDSFEVTLTRALFAERVPFRLTRMIVNALDGASVDGLFRSCCEDILYVLREQQSPLIAQLEIFVHEPIFTCRTNSQSGQHTILSRVSTKLSGTDTWNGGESNGAADVSEQVGILIDAAADPAHYVRHYVGWCPFW